ncbi:MAG TPA: DUF4178 domain-containing protein [Gallionellaceae bacterium]
MGHTVSAVCSHCSTVIDTANDNFRIIKKDHQSSRETDLPIGARGVLQGVKWEVIGYVEKKDKASLSFWDEYLLFNPYFGFRFLIQADNHWNLASVIKRDLPLSRDDNEVMLDGQKFSVFYRGQSSVEYVKGEFYWRVRKGDQETYADYVAPPRMLSVERSPQEINLSLAEYVLPEEVERAFGVTLPRRIGVAPNQPAPFHGALSRMWQIAFIAVLASFVIQQSSGSGSLLLGTRLHIEQVTSNKSLSTPVFNIPRRGNVQVQSGAPLQNNWADLDLSLAREDDNSAYEATQAIEYYSGYDGGDYWSEGSTVGQSYFSAVEPGNYRLIVEPATGLLGTDGLDVSLEIRHGVATWGNFWLIALLILILPVYAVIRRWYFEYRRWSNSDYAPAIYRVEGSDD